MRISKRQRFILRLYVAGLMALMSPSLWAFGRLQGLAQRGGETVLNSVVGATVKSTKTYPLASVEIRLTGTSTKATLVDCSDYTTTVTNPITANSKAEWSTCIADGTYDAVITPAGDPGAAFTQSRLRITNGLQWFNVKDYGAKGDGSTNDATAINRAFAAAAVSGGTLYFPTGTYAYTGTGIDHNPANGVVAPLRIVGDGMFASTLNFTSVSNAQAIRLSSQSAMANNGTFGMGIYDIGFNVPQTTKNGIVISNLYTPVIRDVQLTGGNDGLQVTDCSLAKIDHDIFSDWSHNGITYSAVTYSGNIFEDVQLPTARAANAGFEWNATENDGPKMRDVIVNSIQLQYGFYFHYTGGGAAPNIYTHMNSCISDGPCAIASYAFIKVGDVWGTNNYAASFSSGAGSSNALLFDNARDIVWTGGNTYTDGVTAADISFKNVCTRISITGTQVGGVTLGYKSDGSAHTEIHIDNAAAALAATAVTNVASLQDRAQARSFAYRTTTQSTTSGVWTALSFDTNEWDFGPVHSTAVNPTRFTAQATGEYMAYGGTTFTGNATGIRGIRIRINGGNSRGNSFVSGSAAGNAVAIAIPVTLLKGDYAEIEVEQTSGGNLNAAGDCPCTSAIVTNYGGLHAIKVW